MSLRNPEKVHTRPVAVVIPVYKAIPGRYERISFRRCRQILHNHPLVLVCPESLDVTWYLGPLSKKKGLHYRIERFEDEYFENLQSYNRLMLTPAFYERFSTYEYMLVFQLDSYIFRDDLLFWCRKEYAFIGAAIGLATAEEIRSKFPQLFPWEKDGSFRLFNGGFSLRRVRSILEILYRNKDALNEFLRHEINEDLVICYLLDAVRENLPSTEEASSFSFEAFPARTYRENDSTLPTGCHGWYRNDLLIHDNMFWFKRIKPLVYLYLMTKQLLKTNR